MCYFSWIQLTWKIHIRITVENFQIYGIDQDLLTVGHSDVNY